MSRNGKVLAAALVLCAAGGMTGLFYRSAAQETAKQAPKAKPPQEGSAEAAVRKTADEFVKAFNKGDAKAVAAFWTRQGEYVGPSGEPVRGRAELEKLYTEFFKDNPKARVEVEIISVRVVGPQTALEEGKLKLFLPGDKEPGVSRYSVLHVRERDGWRMATVREWIPDPSELVSLKDLEWLIGDWVAKKDKVEVTTRYFWDEDRAYLRCRYTMKQDGKVVTAGTQIIGKDPAGGLRSWQFDRSGSFGESVWVRDGKRWVIQAAGTLADGSETTAVNLLVPVGKDAFTWQSVERTAGGSPLPDITPVRVTRVQAGK
jgi:uncharacterized protein (TIGR02246 family)